MLARLRRWGELVTFSHTIFALPFGRSHDWDSTALRIAIDQGHTLLTADGGINQKRDATIQRVPADGRVAKDLLTREIVGW